MHIEFRKARIPAELRTLARFDKRIFQSDAFPQDMWRNYEAWWMMLDGKRIGCCAFHPHVDFQPDTHEAANPKRTGSLYIATTGILPEFRQYGFGKLLKSWQVAYARFHNFKRIVTNSRKSNRAMIELNRQFGFRKIQTVPNYHDHPEEATVVMELVFRR
jgi:ribosomal protein S18 acetylase RimI-like enzyme